MQEILKCKTEMKATEQYLSVVLFVTLYKVVLNFEWCKLNPHVSLLNRMLPNKSTALFQHFPKSILSIIAPKMNWGAIRTDLAAGWYMKRCHLSFPLVGDSFFSSPFL